MSQFNAKKCGFSSFKREKSEGIGHRSYKGPHVHCRPESVHTWDSWRVYKPVEAKTGNKSPSSLFLGAAEHKQERTHNGNPDPGTPAMQTQAPTNDRFIVRIVWVRRPGKEVAKSMSLFNRLSDEGMNIRVLEAPNLTNLSIADVPNFDLILFEYFDHVESEMKTVISQIRSGSRAPLMLLTDDQSVNWSMDALNAGADAIFTVSTPDEVILARCNALLRRWLASA